MSIPVRPSSSRGLRTEIADAEGREEDAAAVTPTPRRPAARDASERKRAKAETALMIRLSLVPLSFGYLPHSW